MEIRQIDTDLLIIGGGSAGCMAAIRALDLNPDLKVVFFEKGDIKYSGSIARGMDALNIVAIPNFTSPELYVEAITTSCQGVLDAAPSYLMAARSFDLLKKLQNWGVYFPVDENGKFRTLKYHVKGEFQTAMEEPDLKVIISRMAQEKGAVSLNRIMGLQLLLDDGRAAGAVGIHVRSGELVVCKAKAVLLAAGGQARFSLPNSGYLYGTFDYPGNTGDGYVMGFEAGAALTCMEHSKKTMLIKDANMPLLAITVTRGGRVMDIFDNIIMENECAGLSRMEEAFSKGLGPLRIKLSHLKPEIIEEIEHILFSTERPVQERFFKSRAIDFRKRDIELWPTEAQICGGHGMGGLCVNEKAETNIAGLYAAGDVASVPKQHLSGAFVFGEVAAEEAVEFIASNPGVKLNGDQVSEVEDGRNRRYNAADRDIDVRELEYKVRRLIEDYVVSPKNEYKLNRWLEWSERFIFEINNRVAVRNGHELSKLYEVEHIVRCADFSALASLERKESRWGDAHYRVDYPDKDDKNWLRHVIVHRGDDPYDIQISTKPVTDLDGKEVSP
jgi:succinate dehydrogenase/fumarate reductase flavoprotein subunit